ncbi:MAG: HEAT repeat domain-containing protein [Deltaproteobacteria bacterium]|nr:HEAT repeat domain-containing protein [Deltaproteobacteria bacterium]
MRFGRDARRPRRSACLMLIAGMAVLMVASPVVAQETDDFAPPTAATADPTQTALAEILRLEDRRATADKLLPYLAPDWPMTVRLRAVTALGACGDPDGADALLLTAQDKDNDLARAAIHALGVLFYPGRLSRLGVRPDDRVLDFLQGFLAPQPFDDAFARLEPLRAEAAAAFGKLARERRASALLPFLRWVLFSEVTDTRVAQARAALYGLMRARPFGARQAAVEALAHADPRVREMAAYVLGELAEQPAAPFVEQALGDNVYEVRLAAATALGKLGGVRDVNTLVPLVLSPDEREVIAGLAAYGPGTRGVPIAVATSILQTADEDTTYVKHIAVIRALGRRGDPDAIALLRNQIRRGGAIRLATFDALADAQAGDALMEVSLDFRGDYQAAAHYVDALAKAESRPAAKRLSEMLDTPTRPDAYRRDPRGVFALIRANARAQTPAFVSRLRSYLADDDEMIRALAGDYLAAHPDVVYLDSLIDGLRMSMDPRRFEACVAILGALERLGRQFPDRSFARGKIIDAVTARVRDKRPIVRQKAAEVLVALGGPAHKWAFFNQQTARHNEGYDQIAASLDTSVDYLVETNKGAFVLRTSYAEAPLTAQKFDEYVRAGFYTEMPIYRMTPNYTMQTGDPDGTGFGGEEWISRDELARMDFTRGTIGMATSGLDTARTQFFITHRPLPQLDGRYTAFGRVVEGEEILERLVAMDRVIRIRRKPDEWRPTPTPKPTSEQSRDHARQSRAR